MRAWDEPEVPRLPGRGSLPAVCDTATGSRLTVGGPTARMYVCGITPYDATHIGHAATYIAFDLLVRAWRDAGCEVTYVQNITDVDDPLLERAALTGEEWDALAERDIELFRTDMTALRVLPPQHYIGAVEAMELVINAIDRLRSSGAVYRVEDDLYFAVGSDPDFGSIGHLDKDTMRSRFGERGGDPDRPGKRDPLDCLVWRAERPGEPAWDSPFGRGRPGWHVECTAIARTYLGQTFDVQGGGSDLIFPHHEMCASQAHVIDDAPFARAYVHAGMVGLGGVKMSKSRGNLVFVSSLRELGVDPMALRLAILAHHYRDDWSWEDADLELAVQRLARWRAAVNRPGAGRADDLLVRLRAALVDDLDAPTALAAVDDWTAGGRAGSAGSDDSPASAGLVRDAVDALLGVTL